MNYFRRNIKVFPFSSDFPYANVCWTFCVYQTLWNVKRMMEILSMTRNNIERKRKSENEATTHDMYLTEIFYSKEPDSLLNHHQLRKFNRKFRFLQLHKCEQWFWWQTHSHAIIQYVRFMECEKRQREREKTFRCAKMAKRIFRNWRRISKMWNC